MAIVAAHVLFNLAVVVRTVGAVLAHAAPRPRGGGGDARRVTAAGVHARSPCRRSLPAIGAAASIVFVFTFTSFGVVRILGGVRQLDDRGGDLASGDALRRHRRGGDADRGAAASPSPCSSRSARLQRRRSRPLGLTVGHQRLRAAAPRPAPASSPRPRWRRRPFVVAPLVALVERSLRTRRRLLADRVAPSRRGGGAPGDLHRRRSARRRCVTSLRVMVVAVAVAVTVGSLAALAIAAARSGGKVARHGDDAADRHVGGDDRLRHAHHVRRAIRSTGGRRGGSCRSAMPSSRSPSSCARCCPCSAASTSSSAGGGGDARRLAAAGVAGDRPAAPPAAARRRRRARRGDLARRVRRDQLPVAQRPGDDADRDRAAARAHRARCSRHRATRSP